MKNRIKDWIQSNVINPYYFRNPLNTYFSKRIYSNDCGVISNVVGNLALSNARKDSSIDKQDCLEARRFRENGFVTLQDVYDDELINSLQQNIQRLFSKLEREDDGETYRIQRSSSRGHTEIFQEIPELEELITSKIKHIIRQYFQSHFKILFCNPYRTCHIPESVRERNQEQYSEYWHHDGSPVDHIKLFVNATDVTEQHGPLHLIPSGKSEEIVENGFHRKRDGAPGGKIDREYQEDIVRLTGPPGTAALANTNYCLHRAGIPDPENHRDIVTFYIASSKTSLPDNWPQQATQNVNRGFRRLWLY